MPLRRVPAPWRARPCPKGRARALKEGARALEGVSEPWREVPAPWRVWVIPGGCG